MLSREWFTASELAGLALPGVPTEPKNVRVMADRERWQSATDEGRAWRPRQGRGGGVEYHYSLLPLPARAALALRYPQAAETGARAAGKIRLGTADQWTWFERLTDKKKARAREKLQILDAVEALIAAGTPRTIAILQIAAMSKVAVRSIHLWAAAVRYLPRADWLPYLAPAHAGSQQAEAECSPEAWTALCNDYLRKAEPSFESCHRRLVTVAKDAGWTIPSARTLQRRIEAIPLPVRVLGRKGPDALKRMIPAQERDRGVFHALEAVNADGHVFDVMVEWPDGKRSRPILTGFQDLYSGLILGWRLDRTENQDVVRLAFGDVVSRYGIPDHCWMDNGRHFASRMIAGGSSTRYRFKIRSDEPSGLMTTLGVQVHWTTPYSGQSKPIERAWLDLTDDIARHPACEGAYTGNSTSNKPENYGARAIPFAAFEDVVARGIVEHNTREGRRSKICAGRSFRQTFDASYAKAPIRKATPEQRRLWLMAAEAVKVRGDSTVHLLGNRYHGDFMLGLGGATVVLRFDPDALHDDVHLYRLDGSWLGSAPCIEAVGFADTEAARRHAQQRRQLMRGIRMQLDAEASMSLDELAALHSRTTREQPEPPPPTIVRLTHGNTALQPLPDADADAEDEAPDRMMQAVIKANRERRQAAGLPPLQIVPDTAPEDVS